MPYVENDGARIWWEEQGSGEPILLIMGLSFTLDMWHRTAPALAPRYRLILFDNRGVGRSGVPRGPYWIPRMARDARAVLDSAGVQNAHLIGASMGGMIAQEFTLRWPERVRSLVLACSTCGGPRAHLPRITEFFSRPEWNRFRPEDRIRAFNPLLYAAGTPDDLIEEDTAIRLRWVPTFRGYRNQILGLICWSSYRRLPRISCPTLVIHGDSDLILPPQNALTLARRIPNARRVILPSAGHMFSTDQPTLAHRALFDFLDSLPGPSTSPRTALP